MHPESLLVPLIQEERARELKSARLSALTRCARRCSRASLSLMERALRLVRSVGLVRPAPKCC